MRIRWLTLVLVADEQLIEFLDPRTDRTVRLANGDRVELGGGEAFAQVPWIAEPDPSCPAALFGIGTVGPVNGRGP